MDLVLSCDCPHSLLFYICLSAASRLTTFLHAFPSNYSFQVQNSNYYLIIFPQTNSKVVTLEPGLFLWHCWLRALPYIACKENSIQELGLLISQKANLSKFYPAYLLISKIRPILRNPTNVTT